MANVVQFLKQKKWFVAAGIVILVVIVIAVMRNNGNGVEKLAVVRGDVISEVSVTGQVKPTQNIDLAFEKAGRIAAVYVAVGNQVSRGARLVSQENTDLQAQLTQAQATLKQRQAELDGLEKGTRAEELAAKKAELEEEKTTLASYYTNTLNVVSDAFAKADDAVRGKTDYIFVNGDSTMPQLSFMVSDSQVQVDVVALRVAIGEKLVTWQKELNAARSVPTQENLEGLLFDSENHLELVRTFLTRAFDATSKAVGVASATLDTYKSNISTGRTNVNTAATNVAAQRKNIATQKLVITRIQSEYDVKVAGATPEQISAQEALALKAQGDINYYLSQIAKTVLRTPFTGTVTKIVNRQGEIVAASAPVVSVVGEGKYEIEAYIAESDIAKVKIGDAARVTLDAYGPGVLFGAAVTKIDLSETVLEGVATYKTILQFSDEDKRVLPGLTANVDILSERKENVLYVPTRNVVTRDGKRFVNIVDGKGAVREVEVTIGIRGSDGRTEIVSGLEESTVLATGQ